MNKQLSLFHCTSRLTLRGVLALFLLATFFIMGNTTAKGQTPAVKGIPYIVHASSPQDIFITYLRSGVVPNFVTEYDRQIVANPVCGLGSQPPRITPLSNGDFLTQWNNGCVSRFGQNEMGGFSESSLTTLDSTVVEGVFPNAGWWIEDAQDLNNDGIDDLLLVWRSAGTSDAEQYRYKVALAIGDNFDWSADEHLLTDVVRDAYMTLADLNQDQLLDLVYYRVGYGGRFNTELLLRQGLGNGLFAETPVTLATAPETISSYEIQSADFNGDGNTDLFLGTDDDNSDEGQTHLVINNGDGTFNFIEAVDFSPYEERRPDNLWVSATVCDLQLDGNFDLIGTHFGSTETLFHAGDGKGSFDLVGVAVGQGEPQNWIQSYTMSACSRGSIATSLPFSCSDVTEIPSAECKALINLYDSTNGPNWVDNTNWLATNTPCGWHGVSCFNGHVDQLELISNQLNGSLPPTLGNLTEITSLTIAGNVLATIPPELGNLTHLVKLDLASNQLSGGIPPELGNLVNLKELNLVVNNLTGVIPVELANLANLEVLNLNVNSLGGTIPPELGNLSHLTTLSLFYNGLTGTIPPELGNLTNLQQLALWKNGLIGNIPPELGKLTNLTHLQLWYNNLTGNIPPELGNLTNLVLLDLSINQLSGNLPTELGNLVNLNRLSVRNNNGLMGGLPPSLTNLDQLATLEFYSTGLCVFNTPEMAAWLAGVGSVQGTGIACPATTTPSISVNKTPSRVTLPPSGGYVEFSITVNNTSSADLWRNPIQIQNYADTVYGAIAPDPRSWEGDCYWWLPKLWPTQSWTCHFNEFVRSHNVGTQHRNTVTVKAVSELGTALAAEGSTQIDFVEGQGVWSADSWQATPSEINRLARPIDSNNDGSLDTTGFLIGDLNLNGKCDLYELWWARQCIPLTLADAKTWLNSGETGNGDYRLILGRELLATWLNIVNGNDYSCAGVPIVGNLSNFWLWQRAPQGNPLNGGTMVSAQDWASISWAYGWLQWYNELGGQNCAIDRDTGKRINVARSATDDFVPLEAMHFADGLTDHAWQQYDYVLSADENLRAEIHALYLETLTLVMTNGTISADYLARLENLFNRVVAEMDQSSADEFRDLWQQLALSTYQNGSARTTWREINKVVPTSIVMAQSDTVEIRPMVGSILWLGLLLCGTVWHYRKQV